MTESNDEAQYKYSAVINKEGQYSIWLNHREIPKGWTATGFSGSKEECLAHIDKVWTDMRPLSLRNRMDS
jgi:MbtH protein